MKILKLRKYDWTERAMIVPCTSFKGAWIPLEDVVFVFVLSCVQFFVNPWTVAASLLCSGDYPSHKTRMGCHFFLQGSSWPRNTHLLCLLHWQADSLILYQEDNEDFPILSVPLCCCFEDCETALPDVQTSDISEISWRGLHPSHKNGGMALTSERSFVCLPFSHSLDLAVMK